MAFASPQVSSPCELVTANVARSECYNPGFHGNDGTAGTGRDERRAREI